jgi:hypothetical protein
MLMVDGWSMLYLPVSCQHTMSRSAAASSSMEVDDVKQSGNTIKRLMITNLVLENFKSYGGRKEIGMFHKV